MMTFLLDLGYGDVMRKKVIVMCLNFDFEIMPNGFSVINHSKTIFIFVLFQIKMISIKV